MRHATCDMRHATCDMLLHKEAVSFPRGDRLFSTKPPVSVVSSLSTKRPDNRSLHVMACLFPHSNFLSFPQRDPLFSTERITLSTKRLSLFHKETLSFPQRDPLYATLRVAVWSCFRIDAACALTSHRIPFVIASDNARSVPLLQICTLISLLEICTLISLSERYRSLFVSAIHTCVSLPSVPCVCACIMAEICVCASIGVF